MKLEIHEHFWHFLVLIALLLMGSTFILYFRADHTMVIWGTVGMSASYVLWGVLHHWKEGTLHPKVLAEYVLMAVLGSLILLSVIR